MTTNAVRSLAGFPPTVYSLEIVREEARQLIKRQVISRHQPIYRLCEYIPAREWLYVTAELERGNYLLRDRVGDLLGIERWTED